MKLTNEDIVFEDLWWIDNAKYFDDWFDPDTFQWYYSLYLAEFCSDRFDDWWDPEVYCFSDVEFLFEFCSEHFEKWWPYVKNVDYTWRYAKALARYCNEYFREWYNPSLYFSDIFTDSKDNSDKCRTEYLVKYCISNISTWHRNPPSENFFDKTEQEYIAESMYG